MNKGLALTFAAAVCALATPARAQGFDAQAFHPVPGQRTAHATVAGGRVLDHLEWEAGGIFSYAANPLVQRDFDGNEVHTAIGSLVTLDLLGSVGLTGRLELGLDVPLHLVSTGDDARAGTTFLDPPNGAGLGDVRVVPRVRFLSTGDANGAGFHLAGQLGVALPTGSRDDFRGGGFQLEPRLIGEIVTGGGSAFALNLGYVMRDQSYFADADLEVDDAISWGLGVHGQVHERVAIVADVHGEVGYASVTGGTEAHPIEGLIGAEAAFGDTVLNVGFGRGLSHGFAVPDFRFYVGASYGSPVDPDRDLDGIARADDRCPDAPEDIDGFEDDDGCPDPDDDQDGILDLSDRCDDEPEDMDGFEDGDGCPDPDNDGDGILDGDDQCPDEAEDVDLFEDADGCPEGDNDGDSIEDASDACPSQAEDVDGFEDGDGCPDPDNDADAIPDSSDACPDDAEVVNGIDDADGCPEPGAIALDLRRFEVRMRGELTWFEGATDDPTASAAAALGELGGALVAYPELRVRIVVRSADRAHLEGREALSARRADAIRAALVAAGVAPDRIEASPYAFPLDAPSTTYEVELRLLR